MTKEKDKTFNILLGIGLIFLVYKSGLFSNYFPKTSKFDSLLDNAAASISNLFNTDNLAVGYSIIVIAVVYVFYLIFSQK